MSSDSKDGCSSQVDLIHNGSNVAVTNENKLSYIYKVADYRLNRQLASPPPPRLPSLLKMYSAPHGKRDARDPDEHCGCASEGAFRVAGQAWKPRICAGALCRSRS